METSDGLAVGSLVLANHDEEWSVSFEREELCFLDRLVVAHPPALGGDSPREELRLW